MPKPDAGFEEVGLELSIAEIVGQRGGEMGQ